MHARARDVRPAARRRSGGRGHRAVVHFVSTANAFALRGATPVFVDIRPDTLNIDETLIEAAITPRTKAMVVVHYAGVGCEMDAILRWRAGTGYRGRGQRPGTDGSYRGGHSARSAIWPRSAFTKPRTSTAARAARW